jgi:DNA polymerase I
MQKLFLIDASGFLYRAYFAIQGMSNRQGEATNALFGFIRSYFRLIEDFQPEYIMAVFDGKRSKESRTELYAEYKAHRKETSDDLIQQIIEANTFCKLMGIPILSVEGVEADDTIASVTKWAKTQASEVFICTQDKDLAQLVDKHVHLINPHKDNLLVDEKKVEELFGVKPHQIVDYLAIIGDASDNIPGVSGFGPKTAVALLQQYGDLKNILAHKHELGGKKAETLEKEEEIANLSYKLAQLNYAVDFPQEKAFFKLKEPNWYELKEFFRAKEFNSMLKYIPREKLAQEMPEDEKSKTVYHTIQDEQALDKLIEKLKMHKEICFDTETTSEYPLKAQIVGIGLGVDAHDAYYIPLNAKLPKKLILDKLKPLFESSEHGFFGHNVKYDLHIMQNEGIRVKNLSFDTILASYLLNAHQRRHSLDELSLEYLGKKKIETSDLIGKGKKQISMDDVPLAQISEYCCEDVECTVRLKALLEKELKQRGLENLLMEIELPLLPILAEMERKGMYVDVEFLKKLSVDIAKDIAKASDEIFLLAGEEFNINSPKQLSQILFQKLLIPPVKKGRTMLSTSAEVLENLAVQYPIAQKILNFRSIEKLRSTYIDSLPSQVDPKTERIHCQFNQSVAATGRLSCQDPNLQNIPVRTELGRKIREAFKPQDKNYSFLSADYSQIELRILAHMTEDEGMLHAFENGLDVHAHTASKVFSVPLEEVTPEMRRKAKAVNFGIIYGQQAFGLSQELQIPVKEAAHFITEYYKRYPRVQSYIEHAKTLARKTGKTTTLTGRERLIPEINSSNQILRSQAERLAINAPLQGTAADIIKIAMLRIDSWLKKEKLKAALVLQIHDELIFEAPDSELQALENGVKHYMENVFELKVPLVVQIGIGKNWKEC